MSNRQSDSLTDVEPAGEVNFRRLFANATSRLVRRFGVRYWETIEDAVQSTLATAVESWARSMPNEPNAWVFSAAYRKVIDQVRRDEIAARAFAEVARHVKEPAPTADPATVQDDNLRMLFICCNPILAQENCVPLALKSIGGFGIRELASAFLVPEEAMKKRVQRARKSLMESGLPMEISDQDLHGPRLESVRQVIYLIFNEGYFSSLDDQPIREDMCGEAIRLASTLAHDDRTADGTTHALCALLLLHASRTNQRHDQNGQPVFLQDQDRGGWDQKLIRFGAYHLHLSTQGTQRSFYHYEAAIAYEHCKASSFQETDWSNIVQYYDRLCEIREHSATRMGRAIAVSFHESPVAGLRLMAALEKECGADPNFHTAVAEMHRRGGQIDAAKESLDNAMKAAKTTWQQHWIQNQISKLTPIG